MTYQRKSLLQLGVLHFAAALLALLVLLAADAAAQSCTLRTSGYVGGCSNVNVLWFTQTAQSSIKHFSLNTFAGNFTVPNTARSFSIPTTCSSGGQVVITEVRTNNTSCTVQYSGNLPHNRPCDQCGGISSGVSIVSAANFRGAVSRGALVSAFPDPGVTFTDRQEIAGLLPLPTMMGGISVEVDGQLCGLSAVAPGQINFVLPENLPAGPQEVSVIINSTRGTSPRFFGRAQINPNAPGLFTINAAGTGTASAVWLVATQSGQVFYFNAGSLPPLNPTDRAFLIVYGTGIHEPQAELWLTNGRRYDALHSVATIFPGLWQLAFPVPVGELWQGQMSGFVRVFNSAGYWDSQGVDFRR